LKALVIRRLNPISLCNAPSQDNRNLKTCYRHDLTVGISCTNLLSIYLDYQLHLLSATMLIVSKDNQKDIYGPTFFD